MLWHYLEHSDVGVESVRGSVSGGCETLDRLGGEPRLTSTTVIIGGIPVRLWSRDRSFSRLLRKRYANFLGSCNGEVAELTIHLLAGGTRPADSDLEVECREGSWHIERGDFRAEWDRQSRRGAVWQARSPYALDSVLRILHTLILAERGGFLLHAASIIRNGRALVFAGRSGAGKTTMCRLAPPDATLREREGSSLQPV